MENKEESEENTDVSVSMAFSGDDGFDSIDEMPGWATPYADAGFRVTKGNRGSARIPRDCRPECCGRPMLPNRAKAQSSGPSWSWECPQCKVKWYDVRPKFMDR